MYRELETVLGENEELTDYEYSIMARTSAGLCFLDGEYELDELADIYRVGGMYGTLIERVDDLVDGDYGFPQVQDLERFLEDGLEVLETGTYPREYPDSEEAAYLAAEKIHELLEPEEARNLREGMEEMTQHVIKEEKMNAGHETHLESAASMFENTAKLLDMTTAYENAGGRNLWRKTGKILQITDDRIDGDTELNNHELQQKQRKLLEEIRQEKGLKNSTAIQLSEKLIFRAGKIISSKNRLLH